MLLLPSLHPLPLRPLPLPLPLPLRSLCPLHLLRLLPPLLNRTFTTKHQKKKNIIIYSGGVEKHRFMHCYLCSSSEEATAGFTSKSSTSESEVHSVRLKLTLFIGLSVALLDSTGAFRLPVQRPLPWRFRFVWSLHTRGSFWYSGQCLITN